VKQKHRRTFEREREEKGDKFGGRNGYGGIGK